MIRIKFEVEEQEEETSLPIESENDMNNVGGSTSDNTNNGNVCGTLIHLQKLPEINDVVPKKVVPKKKKKNRKLKPEQLDNFTTDFVAVGSKSIKTEPAESSLSLTTQLNNSLNIQSLLRQNRIQNGWTTNEQSIPIGTQQQQQQSFLLFKIEPIVPDNQEVPLSLDQSSSNPNGTQQQQQSLLIPKIEPIVLEIHQEVPLSLGQSCLIPNWETPTNYDTTDVSFLDQSSSNPNSGETTTTTNCDITTTELFPGPRAGLGRRAKLNVCYSGPMEPNPVLRRRKKLPKPSLPSPPSVDNSELASNDNDQHSVSDSISGLVPLFASTSSTTEVAAPSAEAAVPLLVGKKPLRLGIPPLLTLEEKRVRECERKRLSYHRQKAIPKQPMNPEVRAKKRLKKSETYRRQMENETEERRKQRLERMKQYDRKRRQQLLDSGTPEQLEQMRLKRLEAVKRHLDKESEEQREQRLERRRQYDRTGGKQRRKQLLASATPEQLELKRLKHLEAVRRYLEKKSEQRQRRMEQKRQYKRRVTKQKIELERKTLTLKEREKEKSLENQMESPKPGPSMKLPRPTGRCQRNLKSKIYLEPDTDSNVDDSDGSD